MKQKQMKITALMVNITDLEYNEVEGKLNAIEAGDGNDSEAQAVGSTAAHHGIYETSE